MPQSASDPAPSRTQTLVLRPLLIAAAGIAALGLAGVYAGGNVVQSATWEDDLWTRLQYMLVATVLIERTVEVYLNAASINGDDRFTVPEEARRKSGALPAAYAAVLLGLLIALSGLRVLETLGALRDDAGFLPRLIWGGVDIAISGGLMAGGSALFHEAAEALRGGLKALGQTIGPSPARFNMDPDGAGAKQDADS